MVENVKTTDNGVSDESSVDAKKETEKRYADPVMPDTEYAAAVADEDQEELDKARKKLMILIKAKCSSLGKGVIDNQLTPMVYSMNLADCTAMHEVLAKKGVLGLAAMLAKHKRKEKKKS